MSSKASIALCAAITAIVLVPRQATTSGAGARPLADSNGALTEEALEALLAPAEFADAPFAHTSVGDEAQFCLDLSTGPDGIGATLNPGRARWPSAGGVPVVVRGDGLQLTATTKAVTAADVDRGVTVSWELAPLGQVFAPAPSFELEVRSAVVRSIADGRELLAYRAPTKAPRCKAGGPPGAPRCVFDGVGKEALSLAMAPADGLVAVALGGLKPRLEMYSVGEDLRLAWTALFPSSAGGVVEVAFSTEGRWVVALTGDGRLHRFDAATGGLHLTIPSRGRAARALAPGRAIAVAGEGGEVTLWNLVDGTIAWRLPARGLRGPVDELAASGDGRRFATLEYDAEQTVVRVWNAARRELVAQVAVEPYAIADIALDETGGRVFISHERDGLLVADVEAGGKAPEVPSARALGGASGARCRGRLHWLAAAGALGCAVEGGVLEIGIDGELVGELDATDGGTGGLIVGASLDGARTVAVGGGNLFVWGAAAGGERDGTRSRR